MHILDMMLHYLGKERKYIPLDTNARFGVGAAMVDTARAVTAHSRLGVLILFLFGCFYIDKITVALLLAHTGIRAPQARNALRNSILILIPQSPLHTQTSKLHAAPRLAHPEWGETGL